MTIDLKRASHQPVEKHEPGENPTHASIDPATITAPSRLEALGRISPDTKERVEQLLALACFGLKRMRDGASFGHTLRAIKSADGWTEQLEGDSLRYAAIAALGLCHMDRDARSSVGELDVPALARHCAMRAELSPDVGAVALAAWAAAEAAHIYSEVLFERLLAQVESNAPIETVACAWALKAALAAQHLGNTEELVDASARRLMSAQSSAGLFPHVLPASASGRLRAHIGCFADQVYPIQALSRLSVARGDPMALAAADACASRICALQGPAGQWWWHYDVRDGSVAEGYPVYSVHQHAMGPMALLDLKAAGGQDCWSHVILGVQWLYTHPETVETLVCPDKGVVWRKVARREPAKATRALAATSTAVMPGLHIPFIDAIFPPGRIDHECRPYELGWLIYAWCADGVVSQLSSFDRDLDENDGGES